MTLHALYQSKTWEIFLAYCQFSWPFHILALSVCTRGLSEVPRDVGTQYKGAKVFDEAVEDWLCSDSAGIWALIIDVFLNWNL